MPELAYLTPECFSFLFSLPGSFVLECAIYPICGVTGLKNI